MGAVTKVIRTSEKREARPRGCTHFKLRQLTRLVAQHCEPFFAASGVKATQYALLGHIDALGPLAPGQLARRMDLDASTLTRNLQPLIAGGWVEQQAGPDARSRLVQLTPAGRALRLALQADWKRAQLGLNARLGDARVALLHELLDECLELLR